MIWLAVDANLKDNKKIKKLRSLLRMDKYAVMGHMMAFWAWCQSSADKSGLLIDCMAEDVSEAFGWPGDPEALVTAMVSAELLDESARGLIVHDWSTWQESWYKAMEKRKYNADKQREYRSTVDTRGGTQTNGMIDTPCTTQSSTQSDTNVPTDVRLNRNLYRNLNRNQDLEDDDDAGVREKLDENDAGDEQHDSIGVKSVVRRPEGVKCFERYEQTMGMLTPVVMEDMCFFLDKGMDDALICHAIDLAAKNGARGRWQYPNKILLNDLQDKIITLQQHQAVEQERENNRQRAAPPGTFGYGYDSREDFSDRHFQNQRTYTKEDFDRLKTNVLTLDLKDI